LRLGDAYEEDGDQAGSLEQYRAALSMQQALADKQPSNGDRQYTLAFSHNKVGEALSYQADYTGALEQYSAALRIATALAAKSPNNVEWQAYVPNTMTKIAGALAKSEPDLTRALAQFDAAIALQKALVEKFPNKPVVLSNLANSHRGKAGALVSDHKWNEAGSEFAEAIATRQDLLKIDPKNSNWLDYLATDHARLASALIEQSREGVYDTASGGDAQSADAIAAETARKKQALRVSALAEVQQELRTRQTLYNLDQNKRWKDNLARTEKMRDTLEAEIKQNGRGG
jgi:tetratricopeptide (TPR) repeat protein